ncbi:MAG: hypothetical protein QXI19_13200 [Candidatus Caldarchaeum sp.]
MSDTAVYFYWEKCNDSVSYDSDGVYSDGYYERKATKKEFVRILRNFLARHRRHDVIIDFEPIPLDS